MPRKYLGRDDYTRRRLAHEAARLIAEHGIADYRLAKRKAAQQLGIADGRFMPRNTEIQEALAEYQRLFESESHGNRLRALRRTARKAMLLLHEFEPRLVGAVLAGTATRHSDVNLHVFADAPELVAMKLVNAGIGYRSADRRARYFDDRVMRHPVFKFEFGQATIDAMVFPSTGLRQAPACPINGQSMKRAGLRELERLLNEMPREP